MNSSSLDDFLMQATCAVLIDGQIVGTAWLLSADGYLLTAAHVVGSQEPLDEVMVQFVDHEKPLVARVEESYYQFERGIDFAVGVKDWTNFENWSNLGISFPTLPYLKQFRVLCAVYCLVPNECFLIINSLPHFYREEPDFDIISVYKS